jgi:hypothetical protein
VAVDHAHVVIHVRSNLEDLEPRSNCAQRRIGFGVDAEHGEEAVTHVVVHAAAL